MTFSTSMGLSMIEWFSLAALTSIAKSAFVVFHGQVNLWGGRNLF